jgi:hypothetical protein
MDTKKAGFFAAPALVTLGLLSSAGPNQAADSDSQKRAAESGAQLWACLPGNSPVEIGMRVFRIPFDGSIKIGDRAFDIAFPSLYDPL